MDTSEKTRHLTALEINLERTKAVVDIPEKYRILLSVVKNHYGVSKRTEELLVELHHPFVNWEYLLVQLKGLSIGDFYDFNTHEDGLSALKSLCGYLSDRHLFGRRRRGQRQRRPLLLRISPYRSFQQRQPSGEKHGPVFTRLSISRRSVADAESSVEEIIELYEGHRQTDDGESCRNGSG